MATEKATFGAGCFWGVETRFGEITGVIDTAVGYAGGDLEHPTYKEVCTDRTGHAEVVQVTFDSSRVSFETLLDAFFAMHDPTQVNRQGPDWGSQYRSVIFTQTNEQFAQDVPIWEHKMYRDRPMVTKIDGPVLQYRRWFRQFYSDPDR